MIRNILARFCRSTIKYTKNHEWVESIQGTNRYRVGITDHAQEELGEIVHVEYPSHSKHYDAGAGVVTIQSVKTTADVYAPASGKVVDTNKQVQQNTNLINENPKQSWLFEMVCQTPPVDLISEEEYAKFLETL